MAETMIWKKISTNGVILVFMTALVSGVSIFLNSFAVKGFDSSVFTFSKNIAVAILLLCTIFFFKQFDDLKKLSKKQWTWLAAIGLIGGSIPFLLFFKGLQMATGTTSSFIHKTMFIWVGLLALIFLKEKLDKRLPIAMTLLLIGTWFMVKPDFTSSGFAFSTGHFLVLAAVLFWAIENIIAKKLLDQQNISGNIVAWGRMFFGSVFIMIFLIFTGKASTILTMNGPQYLWILITSALLYLYVLTYYNGLKLIPATTATAILTLGAPITAILSLSNNIALGLMSSIGMILLVAGVSLILWKQPLWSSANA